MLGSVGARLAARRMRPEFDVVLTDEILARKEYVTAWALGLVNGSKADIDSLDPGVVQRVGRRRRTVTLPVDLGGRTEVDLTS